jgi:hypothetical protein
MNLRQKRCVIGAICAIIALALVLFPGWTAIHPPDDLTLWIGHAWIFSPPLLPEHFDGMSVERNWSDNIFIGLGALVLGASWVVFIRAKATQE